MEETRVGLWLWLGGHSHTLCENFWHLFNSKNLAISQIINIINEHMTLGAILVMFYFYEKLHSRI